jgi:hypothetical protein
MTTQIRQLNLSIEDKKALKARYEETNNRCWQERIQGVLLKGQGLSLAAISEVVPYNISTISEWIRFYAEAGLAGICVWQYQGITGNRLRATAATTSLWHIVSSNGWL